MYRQAFPDGAFLNYKDPGYMHGAGAIGSPHTHIKLKLLPDDLPEIWAEISWVEYQVLLQRFLRDEQQGVDTDIRGAELRRQSIAGWCLTVKNIVWTLAVTCFQHDKAA